MLYKMKGGISDNTNSEVYKIIMCNLNDCIWK